MRLPRRIFVARLAAVAATAFIAAVSCTSTSGGDKDATPTITPTPTCGGSGVVCVVAGQPGLAGSQGDGGPASSARLYWPQDMMVMPDGRLYIMDWNNHKVRVLNGDTIVTWAGFGFPGDTCSGPITSLSFNHPTDLAAGPDGRYHLASWHTDKIIPINPSAGTASCEVGTVRGCGGYGGPASACLLNIPSSVRFGADGSMYIANQGCRTIVKVDTSPTPIITVFAGTNGVAGFNDACGTAALFSFSAGPNAHPEGRMDTNAGRTLLYVADSGNHRIRQVDLATGCVTTIAGIGTAGFSGDGGPATAAQLNSPVDVAVAADGSIYVADSWNHRIRRFTVGGNIATVAGTGVAGHSPDGTPGTSAMLNRPSGVFSQSNGVLWIADTYNHVVKKVTP